MKTSQHPIVRLVEVSDLPSVARLFETWNIGLEEGREADLLNQLTLIAERGGRTVGCISALVGPSDLAYVDNLVADPTCGSARLSYSLLVALESVLRRLGWRHLQAHVSIDRPDVFAYAQRLGYLDYGLHHLLGKSLASGRPSHG